MESEAFRSCFASRCSFVCVCVWTSVTKRTQDFCNNVAHQLIDRAKVSRMVSCILAGWPGLQLRTWSKLSN